MNTTPAKREEQCQGSWSTPSSLSGVLQDGLDVLAACEEDCVPKTLPRDSSSRCQWGPSAPCSLLAHTHLRDAQKKGKCSIHNCWRCSFGTVTALVIQGVSFCVSYLVASQVLRYQRTVNLLSKQACCLATPGSKDKMRGSPTALGSRVAYFWLNDKHGCLWASS
jgi:hypothetical protein